MKIGKEFADFKSFEEAKSYGFDCVDYPLCGVEPYYSSDLEALKEKFAPIRAEADAAGVEIYQVHGTWPTDDKTPESCEKMVASMKKAIYCAHILGAKCYVIHPAMPAGWGDDDAPLARRLTKERLIALADVAEPYGINVCLENMPFKAHKLSPISEVADLVREIDRDNVKICLDTGHANFYGTKGDEMVLACGDKLACLHVHDNYGYWDFHSIPYTRGNIDWAAFRSALKEVGYTGPIMLETSVMHNIPSTMRALAFKLMYEVAADLDYERKSE